MPAPKQTVMILDGYNIIHKVSSFRARFGVSAEDGRLALLAYCKEWMARRRDIGLFLVVFDGGPSVNGAQEGASPGVRAIYSSRGETADHRIHALLQEWQVSARCVVVSDDGEVARRARQVGAETVMDSRAFAEVLRPTGRAADSDGGAHKSGLTPGVEKTITDELRRLWGG
jgi:predicted RNA-binding protein with PIN domain